jgi:hypothetical protein
MSYSYDEGIANLNEGQKQLIQLAIFVLEFAEVERHAIDALTLVGGISETFVKAVLSGTRAKEVLASIKKLLAENPSDPRNGVYKNIVENFGPINDARNMILHHGISTGGVAGTYATNYKRALHPQFIPLSTEILKEMTDDLQKIVALIIIDLLQQHRNYEESWAGELIEVSRRPWLYKQRQQGRGKKTEGQKRLSSAQRRQRPPKSSPR